MTDRLEDVVLTRPTTGRPGPLDERLYDLVEARFRRIIRDNPIVGTYVGIHTEDARFGDGSRDALMAELAEEKAHLAAVDAIAAAGVSPSARFERDLEIHNLRLAIFDIETGRIWERRSPSDSTRSRDASRRSPRIWSNPRLGRRSPRFASGSGSRSNRRAICPRSSTSSSRRPRICPTPIDADW